MIDGIHQGSKGEKIITVNTSKAEYQGKKFRDLGSYEKRKLDNLIYIQNAQKERANIKIVYK